MNQEQSDYSGVERRQTLRIDYAVPLDYKICKTETISKLLEGYTSNVSPAGLLCNLKDKVEEDNILWLLFDRETLDFCSQIEKRSLIYQKGIVGKVIRVQDGQNGTYDVGIRFVTREEKDNRLWRF